MNMKFIKGMIVGGLISAGVAMACSESMETGKKKMVKANVIKVIGFMLGYYVLYAFV